MTLLLTLVTHDFTVQASDRRATYLEPGIEPVEIVNKAVVVARAGSIAFTGLVRLRRNVLCDQLIMAAFEGALGAGDGPLARLARDATRALRMNRSVSDSWKVRHAHTSFVATGFSTLPHQMELELATEGHSSPLFPFIAVVSNAQDGFNEEWRQEASLKFEVSQNFLHPDTPFVLHVAGQPLLARERKELIRDIGRCLARTHHPESAARLLARAVQRVAARNPAVGANVMCVPIRRSSAGVRIPEELGLTIPVGEHALHEINYFQHPHHDLQPGLGIYLPAPGAQFAYFGPSYVDDRVQLAGMVMAPADQHDSIVKNMDQWTSGTSPRKRGPINRFTV